MKSLIICVLIFWTCFHSNYCYDVDCSLDSYHHDYSMASCYIQGDYNRWVYCRSPYKCCETGCCFDGNYSQLYTNAEWLGLVLNGSALFVLGILTLVICGATYCNDKEDESHLFFKK